MAIPAAEPAGLLPGDFGVGPLFWQARAVIVGDTSTGRIVLWNPAAERPFSYMAKEAVGLSIDVLVARHAIGNGQDPLTTDPAVYSGERSGWIAASCRSWRRTANGATKTPTSAAASSTRPK